MANNKEWQKRSDAWVKAMHESRVEKEADVKKAREDSYKENQTVKKTVRNSNRPR